MIKGGILSKASLILAYLFLVYLMYEVHTGFHTLHNSNGVRIAVIAFGYIIYVTSFEYGSKNKGNGFWLVLYNSLIWTGLMIRSILNGLDSFDYLFFYVTVIVLAFVISYFKYHQEKNPEVEVTLVDFFYSLLLVVTVVTLIWL